MFFPRFSISLTSTPKLRNSKQHLNTTSYASPLPAPRQGPANRTNLEGWALVHIDLGFILVRRRGGSFFFFFFFFLTEKKKRREKKDLFSFLSLFPLPLPTLPFSTSPPGHLPGREPRVRDRRVQAQPRDVAAARPGGPRRLAAVCGLCGALRPRLPGGADAAEPIIAAVSLMRESGLPCFGYGEPIGALRRRFMLEKTDAQAGAAFSERVDNAYDSFSTGFYDFVQYLQNAIPK